MLAELMEKVLLLQSDEKQSLGKANSQYAIENHSLDRWSEKVGQLYKELIGGAKGKEDWFGRPDRTSLTEPTCRGAGQMGRRDPGRG
jgi:hypothetical protein